MWREFLTDEQGQDVVEYSLILVLIGAVALIGLTAASASISSIFRKIGEKLSTAEAAIE